MRIKELFWGILIFFIIFILVGIPDLILGRGDYKEFLYSNLISGSSSYSNIVSNFSNWWAYLIFEVFPIDFGYGFFVIYICALFYWLIILLKWFFNKNLFLLKNEFFLLFCLFLFIISLMPLKIGATGNRLLVLLPFFTLLSGSFLKKIKHTVSCKWLFGVLFVFITIIQSYQSIIMVYTKWLPDVRQVSSAWIKTHVAKGTLVGIENIPIYQMLPDIVIKDFYSNGRIFGYSSNFNYAIVDASTKVLPPVVIITNKELDYYYLKKSSKKQLLYRLRKERYREIIEFKPPRILYAFIGNELNFQTSGLVPVSTISVFKKD